jgi:2-polyprenyl-3-methyl-5-hydroxy-6-metoxy-1,4-benzoquinol methylase
MHFSKEYYKRASEDSYKSARYQQKIIYEFLSYLNFPKTAKVLDIGSGLGRNLDTLQQFFDSIFVVDISEFALRKSRQTHGNDLNYLVADVQKVPFKKQLFDLVICTEVIEHLNHQESAIETISQALKPDGYLIVSSPNYSNLTGLVKKIKDKKIGHEGWSPWHESHSGLERFMSWKKLRNMLNKNFKITKSRGAGYIYAWLFFTPLRNYDSYYPLILLGKMPLLKRWGMNYYILAQKKYTII